MGVSGQSVESHKSFATHYGLPFILLSDEGNKVRELYGVPSTMGIIPGRVTYIIDKKGVVRHIFNSQTQAPATCGRSQENTYGTRERRKSHCLNGEAKLLNLYNTLTRKTEPFQPAEDKQVKMYTCGPSTYQPAHIGNYRTFLFEDILQRYMEYLGYKVKRLMTLTDVEDKAIAQAKKENLTVEELTQQKRSVFFKDFKLLKIKKPDYPVRASSAVDQAAKLISKLLEKGYRLLVHL